MATEVFAEEENRIRAAWAEACFLLMRKIRFGIGTCDECEEDVQLLQAKLESFTWKRKEDAEV